MKNVPEIFLQRMPNRFSKGLDPWERNRGQQIKLLQKKKASSRRKHWFLLGGVSTRRPAPRSPAKPQRPKESAAPRNPQCARDLKSGAWFNLARNHLPWINALDRDSIFFWGATGPDQDTSCSSKSGREAPCFSAKDQHRFAGAFPCAKLSPRKQASQAKTNPRLGRTFLYLSIDIANLPSSWRKEKRSPKPRRS